MLQLTVPYCDVSENLDNLSDFQAEIKKLNLAEEISGNGESKVLQPVHVPTVDVQHHLSPVHNTTQRVLCGG